MTDPVAGSAAILRCMACGALVDCPAGRLGEAVSAHVPQCSRNGRMVAFARLEAELFSDSTP
jgi:hypothetical protein